MINTTHSDIARIQQQAYTDLHGLQNIRKDGKENKEMALRKIADQFESMFVQMMLKSMRSANEVFAKDNPLNSFEMKHHQEMYDNQLSVSLANGNNIGLADAFYRQMSKNYLSSSSVDNEGSSGIQRQNIPISSHILPLDQGAIGPNAFLPQRIRDAALLNSMQSPQDFVKAVTPYAKQAANAMGVDYRVLIAQSALETGWGEHVIRDPQGNQSFNLFNIKADRRWSGEAVAVPTIEYVNGLPQKEVAKFRRYDSINQSFSDYQEFLSQPRYKKAMAVSDNTEQFVKELQQAGYATDPKYAEKIQRILDSEHMKSVN